MKVILIKECKDGKVNDIIDVKDGYGKNFLIKNGFALPFNKHNNQNLQQKIAKNQIHQKEILDQAIKVKNLIEKLSLKYKLKTSNNMVHGSISKKQIIQSLHENGIEIDSHMLEHVKINKIGITRLEVKLTKDVIASLKVEVING